jgi:hypothetical protein
MSDHVLSEELANRAATRQAQLLCGPLWLDQAFAKQVAAASINALNNLAQGQELRLARETIAATRRPGRSFWFEGRRTIEYVEAAAKQQLRVEIPTEFIRAFSRSEEAALALSASFAKSAQLWQYAFKWPAQGFRLFDLQYVESLRKMQSEFQRMAEVVCGLDFPVRTIAHAAMKNAEAFQLVNARSLKEALEGARRVSALADLPVAARYVTQYNDFVHKAAPRHGSPALQIPRPAECASHEEEIGPRLQAEVEKLDPRLAELRREAWLNIGAKGAPALRLAAHAIREIFSEVLRRLAPDEMVKSSPAWQNRRDSALGRPTREMRFEFLLSSHPEKLAAVKQFARSLDKAHEFAHTFPEDPELVRAYLTELETCTYLVLIYSGRGK